MVEINFSEKALSAFRKKVESHQFFKIDIMSYNCCDIQFALVPCDKQKNCEEITVEGATIFISKDLAELFKRFDIDYEEGVFKKEFTFQAFRR